MHPNSVLDIFGGIIVLAIIAVFLTKANTAKDVNAVGTQFSGAIKAASAG